ncbi:MAG: UDP-N-acetylglucosamine--N-acetylmuramyl-(pentapeptide) pyrophosphoryl-undecaprenol N-acetylglucosamine transferase [Chlamydiae bacterium]|nr:UDP-N-acetylglucosamine--N-acetylmuramyl-(pentapeptide) pyrophosphoryl-undecaprenol N-acetylglucosamine transferase [Chlamydiota bacterium]
MPKENLRVLISAGGTGGHLIPAQQLATKLKKKGCEKIIFAAKGLSKSLSFQKENFDFKDVSSASLSKNIFIFLAMMLKGFFQSLFLILKLKPHVVVGFGSYHTFPVMLAALVLRKPIVLFESICLLGKVNRFFAKKADAIAIQFPLGGNKKKRIKQVPVLALPWIDAFVYNDQNEAKLKVGLEEGVFTILVFGGSQGAKVINNNFSKILKELKNAEKIQVIHIIGSDGKIEDFKKIYDELEIKSYINNFDRNMFLLFSASDIAICRSGAATISELIAFDLPSILIPFPKAADDHQSKNASFMQDEVKGSIKIEQKALGKEILLKELLKLLQEERFLLKSMRKNIQNFKSEEKVKNKKDFSDLVLEIGGL